MNTKIQKAVPVKKVVVVTKKNKKESLAEYAKKVKGEDISVLADAEFCNKLNQLADYVEKLNFRFVNGAMDGRDVSKKQEWQVTAPLVDKFVWVYQKNKKRPTGDVYIKTKFGDFPVNVKIISDKSKALNNICGLTSTASKLMYGKKSDSKLALATKMVEEVFTKTPQNYGLLVVNKGTGKVKWSTLFTINDLYVNPTNGFQFSMETMENVKRNQLEGQQFIKEKVVEFFRVQSLPNTILNA